MPRAIGWLHNLVQADIKIYSEVNNIMALTNPYAAYQKYATAKKLQNIQTDQDPQPVQSSTDSIASSSGTDSPSNKSHKFNTVEPGGGSSGIATNRYLQNTILTASPEELTLMLYNGLVKFIMQAQYAIDEKNNDKAHNCIIRAQDIVLHFSATLDRSYEVSHGLEQMYDYMYRRLLDANIKKSSEILEEVLGFAKELRDTWSQAMKLAKQPQQPQTSMQNGVK
jgi:flagellar protein FliS